MVEHVRSNVLLVLVVALGVLLSAACEPVDWPPDPGEVDPTGVLDAVSGGDGTVRVAGWATEFANFGVDWPPTKIMLTVNGGWMAQAFEANAPRPDVTAALYALGLDGFVHPGDPYGFDIAVPAAAGQVTVCVVALNQFRDELNTDHEHVLLGCRTVTVT